MELEEEVVLEPEEDTEIMKVFKDSAPRESVRVMVIRYIPEVVVVLGEIVRIPLEYDANEEAPP